MRRQFSIGCALAALIAFPMAAYSQCAAPAGVTATSDGTTAYHYKRASTCSSWWNNLVYQLFGGTPMGCNYAVIVGINSYESTGTGFLDLQTGVCDAFKM